MCQAQAGFGLASTTRNPCVFHPTPTGRPGRAHFDPLARLVLPPVRRDAEEADLDKLDSAILDLATASLPVHRVVDTIPEPDPEIYERLAELIALDLVRLES